MKHLTQCQIHSVDDGSLIEFVNEIDEHDEWSATHEHEDMPDGVLHINFGGRKTMAMVNQVILQDRIRNMYRKDGITDELRGLYAVLLSYSEMLAEWMEGGFDKQRGGAATKAKAIEKHNLLRAAAVERWKKKSWHSVDAVAKYLLDEGGFTGGVSTVSGIIKDLKPSK